MIAYYLLTDPHGNLNNLHAVSMHYWAPVAPSPVAAASLWRRPPPPPPASPPIFPLMDATQAKVSIVMCMLVLQCGLDLLGIDMLQPLNKLLARGMAMLFPIRMRRAAPPPSSAPAPATAAKKLS